MKHQSTLIIALRWVGAVLFASIAAVAIPMHAAAQWMQTTILDSEGFSSTLAPLAEDAQFQTMLADGAADAVSTSIMESVPANTLKSMAGGITTMLDWLPFTPDMSGTADEFAADLNDQIYGVVEDQTLTFLRSDLFPPLWTVGIREVHSQLVGTLSGQRVPPETATGSVMLTIEVGPLVTMLRSTLINEGVWWAELVPNISSEVEVAELQNLPELQRGYDLLEGSPTWLLVLGISSALLAVALAPRRLLTIGFGGLVLFGVAVGLRSAVASFGVGHFQVLADDASRPLSEKVWLMLSQPLVNSLQTLAGVAVAVAVIALIGALAYYLWERRAQ